MLHYLTACRVPGIDAVPHEDNLRYFDVKIEGPSQSPYEGDKSSIILGVFVLTLLTGGVFKLELFLPDDYPMTPPKIRFLTKIYHPNIDRLGRICLDVLKSKQTPYLDKIVSDISQATGLQLYRSGLFCFQSRRSSARPTLMTLLQTMSLSGGRRTRTPPSRRHKTGRKSMRSLEH